MRTRRQRMAGFTIAEVMVVVGIVAILAAIAAPNMAGMIRVQRIKTAAFDVFSSLVFARSEAIKRNVTVTITPTSGDWAKGWTITDANNTVLREQSGWENLVATGPAAVAFSGTGRLSGAASQIALSATSVDASKYRCVTLDLSGRATTKEGSC
ncbi:MAG TPA: GspH/FimT family pseudopilin [Usitatibacter sp.]|nr:GspH/FimT family pseudopilin [Usitatibacter sp.]